MNKDFIKKNKAKLILVVFVILVLAVLIVLNFNQIFIDENYCDGITIGCQTHIEKGCVNSMQNPKLQLFHSGAYCYCNVTDNICEPGAGITDKSIEGKNCFDEKDCKPDRVSSTYFKCLAEGSSSTQGNCLGYYGVPEGCNYFMVEGKAEEICYSYNP